ncbi:GDP-mannose mannosyl hydrolase [Halopseudomonas laoshanensis]|uniref:GDP-mannose mannosyl hydrolase n=1 Tax=Halopseudomonas laoshanensis TaxID=2268758 RepID=UPI002934C991|nr:GDP-mannose mannosyl hydrolase [Pseudomonas sp. NyZ704]
MFLDADSFKTVVASTPLVSIDLLVSNHDGDILLGQRLNRPAQGTWFVPGGRIYKNESLDQAFQRITEGELGRVFVRQQDGMLGVYEHFYHDSVFGQGGDAPSTHYVVIAYQITLSAEDTLSPPPDQHRLYRWWQRNDMAISDQVHLNSKVYLDACTSI